jgi:hypothetical protein
MIDLRNAEFKRIFSQTLYKNRKLRLAEMSFFRDFVTDTRGDLYPILEKSDGAEEAVRENRYLLLHGAVRRFFCRFFPYATYEITAFPKTGRVGLRFAIPAGEGEVLMTGDRLICRCDGTETVHALPEEDTDRRTMIVSCRPGAFDVYFPKNGQPMYFCTVPSEAFLMSDRYTEFANGSGSLSIEGCVTVEAVFAYIDSGVSIADMRPIRYENGEIMIEQGRVFLTASIRMQSEKFQGVFSWIPGTAELALTGVLLYDSGDGRWCGDVAASVLYHRETRSWYLWVCAFSHGHVLGHAAFRGDPRFGVNVIDITLMERGAETDGITAFCGFTGDEDPDFFFDEEKDVWRMAICRLDPRTKKYRYVFFESAEPFSGYRCVGIGNEGAETGGSFVRVDGELFFLCGNDFKARSDYRIYHKDGMTKAHFDLPDGGFRGWGTLMPIPSGSRMRYYWMTFDRHKGSDYNWSYGNLYCFEWL